MRKVVKMSKRSWLRPALRVSALLLTMQTLTGCMTTMGFVGKIELCGVDGLLRPFHWSVNDTDDSIRQAKVQNAEYLAVCGR